MDISTISGSKDSKNRNGVTILLAVGSVMQFISYSNWVMLLQLWTNYHTLNLIPVYAITAYKEEDAVEEFYKEKKLP